MLKKLQTLLESLLNRGRSLQNDEVAFHCTFCNHYKKKLQVNLRTQMWQCWVCGVKGRSIYHLFKKLKASKEQYDELTDLVGGFQSLSSNREKVKENIVRLPKDFKPLLSNGSSIIAKHSRVYLNNRNVSNGDILRYGIGYCEEGMYSNRVIVPSYNSDGELNYFVGRDIYEGGFKYKNPPVSKDVIGLDLFINWNEPIVLCEGVFDAIAIRRNAIPLFGKTIPKSLMKKIYEKQVKQIYILLDSDAIMDSIKMTDVLMRNGINVQLIKLKDKDPSEMGFKKVIDVIKKSSTTSFSDLIRMKLNGKTKKYMEI